MITNEIKLAISRGYSTEYISLLINFGLWACYFGGVGYKSHSFKPTRYVITDESALCINKSLCNLKALHPNLYILFEYWYIRQLDAGDIASLICRDEHTPFKVSKETRRFLKTISLKKIRELVQRAEEFILNDLSIQGDL